MTYDELSKLPVEDEHRIAIGSHVVPVRLVDLTEFEVYGCATDEPEPAIWLNARATPRQRNRTLVHEVVEVTNNIFDLALAETQIRIIEQAISQAFYVRRRPATTN